MAESVDFDEDRIKQYYIKKSKIIFDKYAENLDAVIADTCIVHPDV